MPEMDLKTELICTSAFAHFNIAVAVLPYTKQFQESGANEQLEIESGIAQGRSSPTTIFSILRNGVLQKRWCHTTTRRRRSQGRPSR